VLNGLRTPTVSALPDTKVPVRTVRPAAQIKPLNIDTIVFIVRSVAQTRSYCSTGTSFDQNFTLQGKLGNLAILAFIVNSLRVNVVHHTNAHLCHASSAQYQCIVVIRKAKERRDEETKMPLTT